MQWIGAALGAVMRLCYQWVQNYGLAVILFTILSKIILFPVSLWVHQNGIKMVRMQARINRKLAIGLENQNFQHQNYFHLMTSQVEAEQ